MDLFSKCKELYEKIRYFEYGIPVDGVIKPVPSAEYYVKNYHFLKPEEFEKYKGGICWDYVEYERKFLEVNDIDFNQYYLITNTPPNYDTHTFVTVKDGDDLIYIESSFKRVEHIIDGVQKFKSLEDIVKLITTNMWYCNGNDKRFDEFKYDVCKFKGHPQYGCTCEEYMKWMDDNSDIVIQDISINPKKINEDELPVEEFSVNKIDTKFNQFVCESATNDPEEYDETLHDHIDDEDDVYNESYIGEAVVPSGKVAFLYKKWSTKNKEQFNTLDVFWDIINKYIKDHNIPISNVCGYGTDWTGYGTDFVYGIFFKNQQTIPNDLLETMKKKIPDIKVKDLNIPTKFDGYETCPNNKMEQTYDKIWDKGFLMYELEEYPDDDTIKIHYKYKVLYSENEEWNKRWEEYKKNKKPVSINESCIQKGRNLADPDGVMPVSEKSKEELEQELAKYIKSINESWTDFKNGVHPSSGLMFHVSLKNDMDGKTINPQLPSYITDGGKLDDNYQEDTKTKRLCVSPSIEGCMIAILNYKKIREHVGDKFYVYTPEKPFSQYKHKTNKEIVKDKLVFDANITKEAWILEPCKLKLYGIIKLKKVKDLKKKPTVEKGIKMNTIKLDYEWIMTPKASGKFNKAIGDSPDEESDKKEKPINEYDNILVSNDEFFMESQTTRNKVLERLKYDPATQTIDTGIKKKDGTPIRVKFEITNDEVPGIIKYGKGFDIDADSADTVVKINRKAANMKNNSALAIIYHEIGHYVDYLNRNFPGEIDEGSEKLIKKIINYVDTQKDKFENSRDLNNHDNKAKEYVADTYATNKTSNQAHIKGIDKTYKSRRQMLYSDFKKAKKQAEKEFADDAYDKIVDEIEKVRSKRRSTSSRLKELYDKDEWSETEKNEVKELEIKSQKYRDEYNSLMDKKQKILDVSENGPEKLNDVQRNMKHNKTGKLMRTEIPSSFKESYDCLIMDNDEFFGLSMIQESHKNITKHSFKSLTKKGITVDHNSETGELVKKVIDNVLKNHSLPSVKLNPSGFGVAKETDTFFYGYPRYIDGEIPTDSKGKQLRFMAQINCKELKSLPDYPHTGLLQFWVHGDSEILDGPVKAIYIEKPNKNNIANVSLDEDLYSYKDPGDFPYIDIKGYNHSDNLLFKSTTEEMIGPNITDLDVLYDIFSEEYKKLTGKKADISALVDYIWDDDRLQPSWGNRVGGYPSSTQETSSKRTKSRNTMLLQLESIDREVYWGDFGIAAFYISHNDLIRKDFSKVGFDWDCY